MDSNDLATTGQAVLSTQRAREITVTPTTELTLTTLGTLTVETRNCTAGADPVLHAFSNGAPVAVDDNAAGGVNARVTVSPTSLLATRDVFVVRAASDASPGQCDLDRNGAFAAPVDVGGTRVTFDDLAAREQIEAVLRPNGAGPSLRLYRLAGASIAARAVSGGTAGGALYSVPSALTSATFVVAGSTRGGVVRVVANDALLADADGDGVGDALEAAVGTCPNATATAFGFACAGLKTPADTDGDGLTDAWELLGRRDGVPQLPLPLYGADPRHKDIFVEVDVAPATVNGPIELPTQTELREAAKRWQDTLFTLSSADAQAHAAALRNPDGLPGVRAHFDVGVAPTDSADATLYGDWGGATVLP